VTVGGMRRFWVCWIWQRWQVRMNHAISAFMLGHQNHSEMTNFIAKIILCPILLYAARMMSRWWSGIAMIFWALWESFLHSFQNLGRTWCCKGNTGKEAHEVVWRSTKTYEAVQRPANHFAGPETTLQPTKLLWMSFAYSAPTPASCMQAVKGLTHVQRP
jgi:hypothetical protein